MTSRKSVSLLAVSSLLFWSCAASSTRDPKILSRSSIHQTVSRFKTPARQMIHNSHPSSTIRVEYRILCPGGNPVKRTVDIRGIDAVEVGAEACEVEILNTDFVDTMGG